MEFDLIVRNGLLRGAEDQGPLDLAVADGHIAAIDPHIDADAEEIDASG